MTVNNKAARAAKRRADEVISAINELRLDHADDIDKATDLPSAFAGVADAFPATEKVLRIIAASLEDPAKVDTGGQSADEHLRTIGDIFEESRAKTNKLRKIFERVIPEDNKTREERYKEIASPSNTVESLMLATLQDILSVAKLPLPLVDEMTLKCLQETIKRVGDLEPSIKPPEKGTISFLNSGPGTMIGHAGEGDIYHNPGNGPQFGRNVGTITFNTLARPRASTPPSEPSSRASTPVGTSRKTSSWGKLGSK
ncbi:hypothetical protein B0T14DRAFT_518070 [Immersiella caudata]|uniref:NACHT-NTPase and P-loop NTPases N-terminal domain-containing protein n=1 Tax=Immersiella caudata TaxID=314043 RepID=A0AA40BZ47_9PEZI|nr:hypothetical protein B0T14DRAFT_518070 [Immersiella caudata]